MKNNIKTVSGNIVDVLSSEIYPGTLDDKGLFDGRKFTFIGIFAQLGERAKIYFENEVRGMAYLNLKESDLDFVVNTAAPQFNDKIKLKRLIKEDEAFRKGLVGSEHVFNKVMADETIMVKISPQLFFEILLRRTNQDLEKVSHTTEKIGTQEIPVFDSQQVVEFLKAEAIIEYLAEMLSSFIKIESFVMAIKVKTGVWRKIRYNNMDIDALSRFCQVVDEEARFYFYKRIADVCLFILGIFPEYVMLNYFYPLSRKKRPEIPGMLKRRTAEDYEEEGRKYYQLAAEHEKAKISGLEKSFWHLYENFNLARKTLNYISKKHLNFKKHRLFEVGDN